MDAWHESSVARHMLSLQILSGSTDPVCALNGLVREAKFLVNGILWGRLDQIIILLEVRLRDGDVKILIARLRTLLSDELVDVAGSAAEDISILRHVTCVARQVLLLEVDVIRGSHLC